MATAVERLMELKEEIAKAKIDQATINGALEQNLTRLKTEFQCRSIDAAKVKLASLKQEKEQLLEDIEDAVLELEKNYEW